jgi:diguanylate cyclase (GGDEF)-like protein
VLIEVPHPMEGSGDVIVEYRFFPIDDGRTAGLGRVRDGQRALADDLGRTRAELLQKQRILDEIQIELSQVPFIDPVTGVWNRLQVIERLASEWSRSERWNSPIAGMMVEIEGLDGPDEVRQREGNAIADEVLKSVARRIKSVVRDHDIVGRYGDSRFCVVAVQCGARGAANLAGRIAARIDGEPIKAIGRVIPIRVRVGCCTNASSGVEIMEDLFDRSLEALSEARARDEVVHCADEVYD